MIRFFYDLFILACKPCLRMEILNNNNKFAEFCQYCAYYIYFWKYVFNNNNNNNNNSVLRLLYLFLEICI